jgi:exonuclease III
LAIKGYKLELETSLTKIRTAIYVNNTLKYKQKLDLELKDSHMVIIDIEQSGSKRIINLYRPPSPTNIPERMLFTNQIEAMEGGETNTIIITGDLNIDLNKEDDKKYHLKNT